MSEFKPGDRVKWSLGINEGVTFTLREEDEGRWTMAGDLRGGLYTNVRPSELTPADPVPDAATLLVRELVVGELDSNVAAAWVADGNWDDHAHCRAFAKYIRANSLTVERVRDALDGLGYDHTAAKLAVALHAALTEQAK